ncbi:hypothetical protein IFM51744_10196 [Aspergillus udagawae]|nr:hypothetical protein IFM51744_10196 [Aspergillus udagawae]
MSFVSITTTKELPDIAKEYGVSVAPWSVRNALNRHTAANATAVPAAPALTPEQPEALIAHLTDRRLVGDLREHSIDHDFFNLLADEDVRKGLKKFAEWPTSPQLWVDGGLVGGLDIVHEKISADPDFMSQYSARKAVD